MSTELATRQPASVPEAAPQNHQQAQQPPQQQQGPGAPAGSDFNYEIPFMRLHNIYGG